MRPPQERKNRGSNLHLRRDFCRLSHTSGLKIGTPVATLPGTWHYCVSAGTGRPGVSILWLGDVESLICNFYLSVAARKIVCADPWDTVACCWDVKQPTYKEISLCRYRETDDLYLFWIHMGIIWLYVMSCLWLANNTKTFMLDITFKLYN